jgi:FkbM family methyltransferase
MKLGDYSRDLHASLCENQVVEQCFLKQGVKKGIMVDVGAHFGGSMIRYLRRGWDVYAFEPDKKNLARMRERLKNEQKQPKVIDTRAVCDQVGQKLNFYSSSESAGISSLNPFHETHQSTGVVVTTTVSELVNEQKLNNIDYLKIDVEGFDFHVLKGVQWETAKPKVILCEFEDGKSEKLGYKWTEMADFLLEKGYSVYVSEWHPIIQYGIPHDWRCLKKYPCELDDENAWGNLVAFENDPGPAIIHETVMQVLKTKQNNVKETKGANTCKNPDGVNKLNDYSHLSLFGKFAEWVKAKNLTLFRIGQFVMWVARSIKVHYIASVIGIGAILTLIVVPIIVDHLSEYIIYLWICAGMAMFVFLGTMAISFLNMKNLKLIERENQYRREIRSEFLARHKKIIERIDTQKLQLKRIDAQKVEIEELQERLNAEIISSNKLFLEVKGLQTKINLYAQQVDRICSRSSVLNFSDFQSFNRRFSKEHSKIIQQQWCKRLNLNFKPKTLAYLAHRICQLETNSRGRLATSIENAVLRVLVVAAVNRKNIRVLEIGTLFGIGLSAIYDFVHSRCDSLHLTAIDPLDGYYEKNTRDVVTDENIDEENFYANMELANIPRNNITLIKALSTDDKAIEMAGKSVYDVLIIDGDHTLNGVTDDYSNYLPFVRKGGFIFFDDYGAEKWPDVKTFVDKCIRENNQVEFVWKGWRTAVIQVV